MNSRHILACIAFAVGLAACRPAGADSVTILCNPNVARVQFAVGDIEKALQSRGHQVTTAPLSRLSRESDDCRIVIFGAGNRSASAAARAQGASPSENLRPEGFSIRKTTRDGGVTYWLIGADTAGAMYGGLELAELIAIGDLTGVGDLDKNPYMALRGTKFNIPLDARTPSYTDLCDAGQNNIAEMWSLDFWKNYLDCLARYRYNFVSCWSLHPFPSLVRVPGYEDIALDDVKRSTVDWAENYDLNGTGFDAPEILDRLETLKKMSIDEKIEFWRKVMAYAKGRNIRFYFITWNIFTNGTYGKYGITTAIDNPTTVDYFRKSVTQMFLTYPDLAGIGLTTGENMPGADFRQKEDWAFETYGRGVLDAAKARPGRKFKLIHRQHQTGANDIASRFAPVIENENIEFVFSFKYAKAHVFSSVDQIYHQGFVRDIERAGGLKTIWTLRNDDNYHFRWGAPDYVRRFIKNIPYDVSRGFYYGSDQYIWGREFLSTEPDSPRRIEVDKHWYHWTIWGRLGYDPDVSDERFTELIRLRFGGVDAGKVFEAWRDASMVYPLTTGFHWGSLDFQWYIEACKSRPGPAQTKSGFHDVNRFITLAPHGGTDYVSIPDYVKTMTAGKTVEGTSPLELSDRIGASADRALRLLGDLDDGGDKELRLTLGDIRAMAHLGKYYSHKIRGATELALYRKTGGARNQEAAVEQLTMAADHWKAYTAIAAGQYKNPLWTNRVGCVDWEKLTEEVMHDIEIAQTAGER